MPAPPVAPLSAPARTTATLLRTTPGTVKPRTHVWVRTIMVHGMHPGGALQVQVELIDGHVEPLEPSGFAIDGSRMYNFEGGEALAILAVGVNEPALMQAIVDKGIEAGRIV